MFYLIGLGLGDCKDITVKGLEIIKTCKTVYLEAYTSILLSSTVEELEHFYGRTVQLADREFVEQEFDNVLLDSKGGDGPDHDVALLVVGDPLGATTHTDIVLRAMEHGVCYQIVHNASILNAVGCCGLQLYCFGETVSIPYWTDSWRPDSFFDKILVNYRANMHTLCLLDIKVKEPTEESLTKKKRVYMPPRFMTVAEASKQLLQIIANRSSSLSECELYETCMSVGLARIGAVDQRIVFRTLAEMSTFDLGGPLHSLIIPAAQLHPMEHKFLSLLNVS